MSDLPPRRPTLLRPPEALLTLASILAGILLPALCLLICWGGYPMGPEHQNGKISAYMTFLLTSKTNLVFYPFLLYAGGSLVFFLFRPKFATSFVAVRFGVYTGVILSLHFGVVLGAVLLDVGEMKTWSDIGRAFLGVPLYLLITTVAPVLIWCLLVGALLTASLFIRRFGAWWLAGSIGGLLLAVAAGLVLSLDARQLERALGMIVALPMMVMFFVPLVSAPSWSTAVYAYQAVRIIRLHGGAPQIRLGHFFAAFTWLAAYLGAWRVSLALMFEAYAKLPVEPPEGCYIATAAAQGHPRVVGSREVVRRDGEVRRVNRQLAFFKCGELALQTGAPRLHALLRRVYNAGGPKLARRLRHPLLADAAYLSLKPLEWAVRLALLAVCGDVTPYARRLYGGQSSGEPSSPCGVERPKCGNGCGRPHS